MNTLTIIITGTLKTRTALHVGAGESRNEADALLRRTAAGELLVPGTAIGGVLRALATRLAPRLGSDICRALWGQEKLGNFYEKERKRAEATDGPQPRTACDCVVCRLFGAFDPQASNKPEAGCASRLWVYDAKLGLTGFENLSGLGPSTWIRDGVGINRQTGAAARQGAVKFDLEVLPAGACFDLRLEVEQATDEDECLLAAVLAEWKAGRGTIGGRVARGLGAFTLEGLTCQRRDLGTPAKLMAYLRGNEVAEPYVVGDKAWLAARVATAQEKIKPANGDPFIAQSWLEVEFTLEGTGPLLVNDPTQAGLSGFDHAPLIEGRPVLTGASLRGVLRSHAERIARTLATERAADRDDFLATCPACSPVARPIDTENVALASCDALLQRREQAGAAENCSRGANREVDPEKELCLACQLFGSPRLGSRLIVEDAYLKEGTEPVYKVQDFLAIDRFTGGGRDGAKFDALALWKPPFTARLRLENPRAWELGWLALVLRDLAEGWLTVGFGAAKGFGKVIVPDWTARIGFLRRGDFPAQESRIENQESKSGDSGDLEQELAVWSKETAVKGDALYQIVTLNGTVKGIPEGSPSSLIWHVPDAEVWQAEIARWISEFRKVVETFKREPAQLPALEVDDYFVEGGLMEKLYPKASKAWQEVVHHG